MRTERPLLHLLAVAAAALGSLAWGHATIVFGTVTTDPAPPAAGAPFALHLEMVDPVDAPVEDAVVFVEAVREGEDEPFLVDEPFDETAPGAYRTELTLPEEGPWTLVFRDRTYRQEEARASVTLHVGEDGRAEPVSFLFPPTATGPTSITTWLLWLVGLPLLAGALVTVLVLRGGGPAEDDVEPELGEPDAEPASGPERPPNEGSVPRR